MIVLLVKNVYSLIALFSFKREVVVSDFLLFLCFGCEMKKYLLMRIRKGD